MVARRYNIHGPTNDRGTRDVANFAHLVRSHSGLHRFGATTVINPLKYAPVLSMHPG